MIVSQFFSKIRSGEIISSNNAIVRANQLIKEKNYSKAEQILQQLVNQEVPVGFLRLASAYYYGEFGYVDVKKAEKLLNMAGKLGITDSYVLLFDIYYSSNDFRLPELIDFSISTLSNEREIQARLGRAYRDGRGVDRDLNKAAEWMRKAVDAGVQWAINDLSDVQNAVELSDP